MTLTPHLRFLLGFGVFALLAVGAGLMLIESPTILRQQRLDDRRVQAIEEMARRLDRFADQDETLPESLEAMTQYSPYSADYFRDPVTDDPYEYVWLNDSQVRLCMTFDAPGRRAGNFRVGSSEIPAHGAGRHCYIYDASREKPYRMDLDQSSEK